MLNGREQHNNKKRWNNPAFLLYLRVFIITQSVSQFLLNLFQKIFSFKDRDVRKESFFKKVSFFREKLFNKLYDCLAENITQSVLIAFVAKTRTFCLV